MHRLLDVADRGDGLRELVIHNPTRRNALAPAFFEALEAALQSAQGVRAWLIRGHGAHFSAGFDLRALEAWSPESARLPDEVLADALDRLSSHPAPSVALVSGVAFGAGCELAMACDFRVADVTARFCLPPAKIGVVYSQRGLARVARVVGLQQARRAFLTAQVVEGAALEHGWVDAPLAADAPAAEAQALALCRTLTAGAPLAIEGMKVGLARLHGDTPALAQRFEALRRQSFSSEDADEGRRAALEKRAPRFHGR